MRLVLIITCFAVAALGAYYTQPYAHKNPDLILILVTVFTVFAGFLIAVITIIGDPIMIREGSWRAAEDGREKMQSRLFRHVALFVFYLLTIGLLFVGVVLERALDDHNLWRVGFERAYLFAGIASFLFTFALPGALLQMQQARYDAEIERRRRNVNIPASEPDNPPR
jgi:MFS family permease